MIYGYTTGSVWLDIVILFTFYGVVGIVAAAFIYIFIFAIQEFVYWARVKSYRRRSYLDKKTKEKK